MKDKRKTKSTVCELDSYRLWLSSFLVSLLLRLFLINEKDLTNPISKLISCCL